MDIWEGLTGLHHAITLERQRNETHVVTAQFEQGSSGRPKEIVGREYLVNLLEMNLPVRCIASLLGESERTVHRRLAEFNLSVRSLYSSLTDNELDILVSNIKQSRPWSREHGHCTFNVLSWWHREKQFQEKVSTIKE